MNAVSRPVLLIDDEPFALKLLARQLQREGLSALREHGRSQEGLADALDCRGRDALLFLDLQMPDLDGIEFLRALAAQRFDGELVLVSGEHRRIVQAAMRLARAHGLRVLGALAKPVEPAALQALLRSPATPRLRPEDGDPTPAWMQRDELLRALRDGELQNHYQPKVDLHDGRLSGVETLVRWHHPQHGLVPPEAFIAFAEREELVQPLTRHVLREALAQMRRWDAAGLPLQVAVNISMDDLDDLALPDTVAGIARAERVDLARLVLEVTESRLMRDPLHAVDALGRLRLKRVSLSIDDYGTGHSSLAQLRDLPFDELKLDRSFVRGAPQRGDLRCILDSTIRMARTLELNTVAEGVETADEWRLLRALGCHHAQGWLIGRAMPGAALPAWHAQWCQRVPALLDDDAVA